MQWTWAIGAIVAVLILAVPATAAEGSNDVLSQLQDEAIAANPGLEARRARIREIEARAAVAGAWMDPMVSVEYSNAPVSTWSLTEHPMSGVQLRVQQTLRPPQWSGQRREVGERAAEAAGHELADADIALRAAVARAYWSLSRTRLLRTVTQTHIALAEELLEAVTARYQVGAVGQHALLRLEVLRDRLIDEMSDFERQEREYEAALARALAHDASGATATPPALSVVAPPDAVDWRALANDSRPALAVLDAQIAEQQAGAALASTEAWPDPTVWVGYRLRVVTTLTDPGVDFVSAGLSVPLPLGSGRAAHGERSARLQAAARLTAEREALLDAVAADGEVVLARWQRAAGKALTYETVLIPAARSALQTTRTDFATGRADFASLFDAQVALLDLERAVIAASAETGLQQAEARALVGAPIGGSP